MKTKVKAWDSGYWMFVALLCLGILPSEGSQAQTFRADMNRKESRALAQELGDSFIAEGTPAVFSRIPRKELNGYIDRLIAETGAATPEVRVEANEQIQRLWRLCVPRLVENLGNENETINEAVMKNLILMRDAGVVEKIIEKVDQSDSPLVRQSGIFALGMMSEERKTLVPNRKAMGSAEFSAIATTRISPFLENLKSTVRDADTSALIEQSLDRLRGE